MARRTILFITLLLPAVLLPARAMSVFEPQDSTARSARPAVALVLGGGGAKGAAHVGALKAVEEAGIQPDIIVGTSIGAIVGGLYSIGYRAADLDTLFRSQRWLQLFTREAIRGNAIRSMLDSLVAVGKCREKERSMAFACIAADLPTLSEVVLDGDSLARNMRASMSIPGLFRPVKFGGRVLIDGGMLNNLPVDVARQMGADVVIAVDLTQNHHDAGGAAAGEKDDFGLSDLFDVTRVKGLLGWLLNRPDFVKHSKNKRAADVYINPPLSGYSATSFARQSIEEMIAIGEKAARKKLLSEQQQPRDTETP